MAAFLNRVAGAALLDPRTYEEVEADDAATSQSVVVVVLSSVASAVGKIPVAGPAFFVIGSVWMLAAMFVAVRQALDYRHLTRALAVCLIGWMLSLVFAAIVGLVLARPVS